jgi:ribose transport system ATP-binding protein
MMVGRNVATLYSQRRGRPGAVRLAVHGLSRWGFFHDVSFSASAGEIVGLGGLSGAGRSELARSLCGIDPLDAGRIELDGRPVRPRNYRDAIAAGLAYLTEDRKAQGLALRMTMGENMLSAIIPRLCRFGLFCQRRGEATMAELIRSLDINPPQPRRMASALSGGNQQKVLLGKWLSACPKVLILDEPTRGVDVGAKVTIHRAIAELADAGTCVILISGDLPELVGLSDRVLIMRGGHLIGQIPRGEAGETSVLLAANGEGRLAPA